MSTTIHAVSGDRELLQCFVKHGDEPAFRALVERHGPLVLDVCRRILGNYHDAEEAFQATFIVLARKASRIKQPELLGCWLYGVAYRVASKARTAIWRRTHERLNFPTATGSPR